MIDARRYLDAVIDDIKRAGCAPTLLLHSCCAPCSSSVLEELSRYFRVTVFYYNPNVSPDREYEKRLGEQKRLIAHFNENEPSLHPISVIEGEYDPGAFYSFAKEMADAPEGGERCRLCFSLRLWAAARLAKQTGADYFTTTLTVSPYKNAGVINGLGGALAKELDVPYLFSDFKKRDGYKRSIALSRALGLYRQHYCGCVYSAYADKKRKEVPLL